jgi:hypothetical protein
MSNYFVKIIPKNPSALLNFDLEPEPFLKFLPNPDPELDPDRSQNVNPAELYNPMCAI